MAGQSLLVCLAALLMVVQGYGAFINGQSGDESADYYDHDYYSD